MVPGVEYGQFFYVPIGMMLLPDYSCMNIALHGWTRVDQPYVNDQGHYSITLEDVDYSRKGDSNLILLFLYSMAIHGFHSQRFELNNFL